MAEISRTNCLDCQTYLKEKKSQDKAEFAC